MITQQHKDKLELLRLDYSVRKDNCHVGSCLGGNITHLGFISDKGFVVDDACQDVSISDKIYFNPAFLDQPTAKIRGILDPMIAAAIEKEGYKFAVLDAGTVDSGLMNDSMKNLDADAILTGGKDLPNFASFNYADVLCVCMRICETFSHHLDNDPNVKNLYSRFLAVITKFDDATSLFSIRTHIGIDRLVRHNLDEVEGIWQYFLGLNKKLLLS